MGNSYVFHAPVVAGVMQNTDLKYDNQMKFKVTLNQVNAGEIRCSSNLHIFTRIDSFAQQRMRNNNRTSHASITITKS